MATQLRYTYPLSYIGSLVWPVLFAVLASPVCLLLLIKNVQFSKDGSSYRLAYRGSWFWAFFWALVFFPVTLILLFLNGADIEETNQTY